MLYLGRDDMTDSCRFFYLDRGRVVYRRMNTLYPVDDVAFEIQTLRTRLGLVKHAILKDFLCRLIDNLEKVSGSGGTGETPLP